MLLRSIQRTKVEVSWITQGQLSPGDQTNKQTINQSAESLKSALLNKYSFLALLTEVGKYSVDVSLAFWGDTPMGTISSNWTENMRLFKGKLLVAAMFGLQGCGCSKILPTDPGF